MGNNTKKSKEGITNQNIDCDKDIIGLTSLVSRYNQIMPKNETSGKDARIPPIKVKRFEISEISTIITAEIMVLIKKCTIEFLESFVLLF